MSWAGTSARDGRDPPPDEVGRVEWAAIPPLAPPDDEAWTDWFAVAGREDASREAWVLVLGANRGARCSAEFGWCAAGRRERLCVTAVAGF